MVVGVWGWGGLTDLYVQYLLLLIQVVGKDVNANHGDFLCGCVCIITLVIVYDVVLIYSMLLTPYIRQL